MEYTKLCLMVFFAGLLVACGGGGSAESPPTCSNENISFDSITGPAITATITVKHLPDTLPVNIANVGDGYGEHLWNVLFDVDDSGTRNTGDIKLELHHVKRSGSQAGQCKLSDFESYVYEFTSETTATPVTAGAVKISGNSIILKVAKSQYAALANISDSLSVQFNTITHDSTGQVYGDSYPVENSVVTFISLPADGTLTDDALDISGLVGVDVRHVDLQTMQVVID